MGLCGSSDYNKDRLHHYLNDPNKGPGKWKEPPQQVKLPNRVPVVTQKKSQPKPSSKTEDPITLQKKAHTKILKERSRVLPERPTNIQVVLQNKAPPPPSRDSTLSSVCEDTFFTMDQKKGVDNDDDEGPTDIGEITESSILKFLICSVCKLWLSNNQECVTCHTTVCSSCFEKNKKICKKCKGKIFKHNHIVESLSSSMWVPCPLCDQNIEKRFLSIHKKECQGKKDTIQKQSQFGGKFLPSSVISKTYTCDLGPSEWVSDNRVQSCGICLSPFSIQFRKHHCRACGMIFCANCSSKRRVVPWMESHLNFKDRIGKRERICDICAIKIKHIYGRSHPNRSDL